MDDRDLEQRLAGYRPVVESAMARRPFAPRGRRDRRRLVVTAVAASTVAAGVVGWVALSAGDQPAATGSVGTSVAADGSAPERVRETIGGEMAPVPPVPSVIAFGDSVMLGADPLLLGAGMVTNASESRQFGDLVPVITAPDEVAADAVVIHVGNNGPIDERDLNTVIDALRDVPRVVVLTIHIDRPWAEPNNALIRALPARYPNAIVLDWDALAALCTDACFAADGFHLSGAGADYYTELIANVVAATV